MLTNPLAVLSFVLCITWPGCAAPAPVAGGPAAVVEVQLLGFNDFHGALEPPSGSDGRIGTVDAGGVEFFATHMAALRTENPNTLVVSAGDNIGASSLLSSMFHDEPTIEAMGEAGLQVAAVGNHEFDEGWAELYRMNTGSCHPVDGCQDRTPFEGAKFQFLSANVMLDPARVDPQLLARSGWRPAGSGPQTLFPATTVHEIDGVKVGFIGLVLQGAADIVPPAGLQGLTFRAEVEAGNDAAAALAGQGIRTIVVLIHQGGTPATAEVSGCGVTGPIVDIAEGLSTDVDVIISGHTHRSYICTIGTKLVTSAASLGRLITDVDLKIDRATGEVVAKSGRNVIVTRDVTRSTAITRLLDHYRPFYATLGNRAVGTITGPLLRAANTAGESALGDVIADAILDGTAAPAAGGAVLALWNSGGIRADLVGQPSTAPGAPATVTFANVFDVLPFGNRVVVRTMTGDALVRTLEQQFENGRASIFQVSSGFSYSYDASRPQGQRVDASSVTIGGRVVDRAARYRVASADFIWSGGGFTTEATDPLDVGVDVEVFVEYLRKHSPLAPGPQNRITGTH